MADTIIVEKASNGVATLVFNRPEKLNSFSSELVGEAGAALADLREDASVRSVVVRGSGRAFSAGFDLGAPRSDAENLPAAKLERWKFHQEESASFLRSFWEFPKPVIAAVHGYCLGGACELAMVCDLTVASEDARFGEPEIRLATSSAMSVLLALFVPPKVAKQLVLGGGLIDAQRAFQVGLVNEVVAGDALVEVAHRRASLLALMDPHAVSLAKESMRFLLESAGAMLAVQNNRSLTAILAGLEREPDEEYERVKAESGLAEALKMKQLRFRELE